MANFRIITNNPKVLSEYSSVCTKVDGSVMDVYHAVRDSVHIGARLISHPLSGSVKPNESPFKSVVLSAGTGGLHMDSLALIEGAIAVLIKLGEKNRTYSAQVIEDFQVIDLDLMRSAMRALPAEFHF